MSISSVSRNASVKPAMLHDSHAMESGIWPTLLRKFTGYRPLRVALVGNHLPRQCGIATFTTDLCDALSAGYGSDGLTVVAINDAHAKYIYPKRVGFEIEEGLIASYRAAALYLNSANIDLVCLQHEYGIFGGDAGSHILQLLKYLSLPVVTTLHTVLQNPDRYQQTVMQQIAALSGRMIVMSRHSSHILQEVFGVRESRIDVIPHGIPDLPYADPCVYKDALDLRGKLVLLTFGLLSPNKGFESVIRALPRILSRHSDAVYLIAGATHPHVRAREGDRYREQLQDLAREMGVEKQVIFYNKFVTPQEMASLVGAADIYITPYCHAAQAVSGTLAYALGAGKAIISTPYWHASELLDDGRGKMVPFEDPEAIADAAIELLENEAERMVMRERAYAYGRQMVWSRVGQSYMLSFMRAHACQVRTDEGRMQVRPAERTAERQRISA